MMVHLKCYSRKNLSRIVVLGPSLLPTKVWKKVTKLIPFICNHMEDISAYYQEPLSKSKVPKVSFASLHSFLFIRTQFVRRSGSEMNRQNGQTDIS